MRRLFVAAIASAALLGMAATGGPAQASTSQALTTGIKVKANIPVGNHPVAVAANPNTKDL